MRASTLITQLAVGMLGLCGCGDSDGVPAPAPAADAPTPKCAPAELGEPGACVPPGVPVDACPGGTDADGSGGCALAGAPTCGAGAMAMPGELACRPVSPCEGGKYGDVPRAPGTQYVDAAYAELDSDGSADKPWKTIQAGIEHANRGATVAVAAGIYAEDVEIEGKPVTLAGRCPAEVEIVGTGAGAQQAAVSVLPGADGTFVRGVSVRGPDLGVLVSGALDVTIDRSWLHDTGWRGLDVERTLGATRVTLTGSLVEGATDMGVFNAGSELIIDRSVVRATHPGVSGLGVGVLGQVQPMTAKRSSTTVRGSLIESNEGVGINVVGCDLTVEDSIVRGTRVGGLAVSVVAREATNEPSTATFDRVLVIDNGIGIVIQSSDATIRATTVRHTRSLVPEAFGVGILIETLEGQSRAHASVVASLVEDNETMGISLLDADGEIESTIVRGTQPDPRTGWWGAGVWAQADAAPSVLVLRGVAVESNHEANVVVLGSTAHLERAWLRDAEPRVSDGSLGDGLDVVTQTFPATAELRDVLIERSHRAGLSSFGAAVTMQAVTLTCNPIALDGEPYGGAQFAFEDRGDNRCGCGDDMGGCVVATSALAPPSQLP